MNINADQQAVLGTRVAELKTLLNDTENKISENKLDDINFLDLVTKTEAMSTLLHQHSGTAQQATSVPPHTHTPTPAHSPGQGPMTHLTASTKEPVRPTPSHARYTPH